MRYHDFDALLNKIPVKATLENYTSVSGGSINQCHILSLSSGQSIFVKSHRLKKIPGMYAAEFQGLLLLAETGALHVPKPLYFDDDYLVIEVFQEGVPGPQWQEHMGRGLVQIHQQTMQSKFGFDCDNFLGTTPQINTWQDNWLTFWREQRLGFQFSLLREKMGSDDPLLTLGEMLLNQLDQILTCEDEPAVLLHGDLWSGNAAANEKGEPVIFDPASYYGHREAEIGMMRLFGGFGPHCEAAYQEVWPLQPGHDRRIEVYKLYHQLNHLNLFGSSYYNACLDTVRRLL
jgi:fructosamine-3-kinase